MKNTVNHHLVAVVGGSGAGKTWFVHTVCRVLGATACRLALDDFYRDRSHLPPARRARLNYDVPHAIDWSGAERVLQACRAGQATQVPRYDFATYSRAADGEPWTPRPLVFVDGLWLLRSPEVRRLFDLKIFLDTPAALRLDRRVARDTAERGYSAEDVQRRLTSSVLPMHDRYVEPQKRWADLVLTQPYREPEIDRLAEGLWPLVERSDPSRGRRRETLRAELVSRLVPHEYCN